MGASISFDSKYKLILDAEVECISSSNQTNTAANKQSKKNEEESSGSESGEGSESGSESGSDSDDEAKVFTVKITPDIVGYIRTFVRNNDFLDSVDTITEIDLEEYGHGPESALVFNTQSVSYNVNENKIEAVGDWEYFEAKVTKPSSSRKHKSKSGGSRKHGGDDDDNNNRDNDDNNNERREFKTKEDEMSVSEIENLIAERFREYSKNRDFVIHETKTSFLSLNVHNVEIVKQ